MNEEYIYDIGKYTIGVDKGGKDEVALSIAKIENEDLYVLGSYYGENAECIDLIIKENKQLKEKLQQKEDIINKAKEFIPEDYKYESINIDDEINNYIEKYIKLNLLKESSTVSARQVRTFGNEISTKDLKKFPELKKYQGMDISYIVYEQLEIL